jgi:hypothetical protein
MDSPTVLCIDDRPQVLELRKATLEFGADVGTVAAEKLKSWMTASVRVTERWARAGSRDKQSD